MSEFAPLKSYIAGTWVAPASSTATIDALNPATEEVCATVAICGPDDVDRAVRAARAAFDGYAAIALDQRIALVIANVLNLIIAPWIVGSLSDYFAGAGPADAESLRLAQMILAPSGLWAAWHYWRAEKYIVEDQKRAVGYV